MLVKQLMIGNVFSCHPENNLAELAAMMWNHRCGALPIIDSAGKVAGMITDRDICIALGTRNARASDVLAREVSPGPYVSCAPGDEVRSALEIMGTQEVSRLPVVDDSGRLVGMLSIDDIVFRAACGSSDVTDREIINTLAAIREERIHQPSIDTENGNGVSADPRIPMNYGDVNVRR
jgi:CBS domain-containing protein